MTATRAQSSSEGLLSIGSIALLRRLITYFHETESYGQGTALSQDNGAKKEEHFNRERKATPDELAKQSEEEYRDIDPRQDQYRSTPPRTVTSIGSKIVFRQRH